MIIIEKHKLIRNLGNDLPFVRKVINKSSFFFFIYTSIDITIASIAISQAVDWEIQRSEAGLGKLCLGAMWRPAGCSTQR